MVAKRSSPVLCNLARVILFAAIYLIVGYVRSKRTVAYEWVEGVTILQKFKVYYWVPESLIPNLIISLLLMSLLVLTIRMVIRRNKE